MITQIREDPMKGTSRPPSEFPCRPTSYSQPFSIPCIHPFITRSEAKSRSPESTASTTTPSAVSGSNSFTTRLQTIQTQPPHVLPSEPSPTLSPSCASSEASSSFSPRAHTHSPFPSYPSYPTYPSPYPSYPPSRSPSTFHLRLTHSRNPSASSLSSFCSNSSSTSSFSRRSKPNTLTKDYLFHLHFQRPRHQPVMMDEDDEWEEWGRGMRGVLEPRIVGPGWSACVAAGVEEVLSGGW
ncbi:hypothetical protein MMC22_006040 [Lobaria immixta]|nr:hypothetical protein [Lobaria immixta]